MTTSKTKSKTDTKKVKTTKSAAAKSASSPSTSEQGTLSAIVRFAGKQFKVTPGCSISVDRLAAEPGASITLDQVLLVSSSSDGTSTVLVGSPLVEGAKVHAKVTAHGRGPRVLIYKKKRRTGYTKSQGHRQDLTHLEIQEIVASR